MMSRPSSRTVLSLSALTLLVTGGLLYAGPLDPPAGPVASSNKTLAEVEPRIAVNATNTPGNPLGLFVISQPGSYYLTQNISIPASVSWGIRIEAHGVTLDLNGFAINGNANDVGGIAVDQPGVTIRNGTISNTTSSGISSNLFPTGSPGLTIDNIRVLTVHGPGIPLGGSAGSGTAGIFAGRGAIIRDCYVYDAALGIAAGFNSNISGCTVEYARQHAFHIQGGATITDCVAVGTGGLVSNSAFFLGAGSTAVNCVARSNAGAGFATEVECSLRACSSTNNSGEGFSVGNRSTVIDCTASINSKDGILCAGQCYIRGNTCAGNIAGIHATGFDNRIDGNTCTVGTRGIDVDFGFNFITRNTCSGNSTNWDVAANNIILVVQSNAGGAVLGNSGGASSGTTDPNANFTY